MQPNTDKQPAAPVAQDRAPWEAPFAEVLDVVADTTTNPGLGADAGAGSSHS